MKKLVLVLALAAIALSGAAYAQDNNYVNNVGVYFDEEGMTNCGNVGPLTPTNLYLVFTKLTSTDIVAWEMALHPDNLYMTNFVIRGQAIDAGSRTNEHLVGYAAPIPVTGGTLVVADISILVDPLQVTSPSYFYSDGVYFHLLPNRVPAYIDGSGEAKELHPVNGDSDTPLCVINDGCLPVATEEAAWGSVKSLFR